MKTKQPTERKSLAAPTMWTSKAVLVVQQKDEATRDGEKKPIETTTMRWAHASVTNNASFLNTTVLNFSSPPKHVIHSFPVMRLFGCSHRSTKDRKERRSRSLPISKLKVPLLRHSWHQHPLLIVLLSFFHQPCSSISPSCPYGLLLRLWYVDIRWMIDRENCQTFRLDLLWFALVLSLAIYLYETLQWSSTCDWMADSFIDSFKPSLR